MTRVIRSSRDRVLQMGLRSAEASRTLERQGILTGKWSSQPVVELPDVPKDITEIPDRDLMELFRKLNHWGKYLGLQLAAAQVDERWADWTVEKIQAFAQIANKTEKNVTVMKALAFEDPDFIKAKEEQIKSYAYRKSVEAVYNGVERDHAQVSRELTRRLGRGDRAGRAGRSSS
jgi:hypothetical protein